MFNDLINTLNLDNTWEGMFQRKHKQSLFSNRTSEIKEFISGERIHTQLIARGIIQVDEIESKKFNKQFLYTIIRRWGI